MLRSPVNFKKMNFNIDDGLNAINYTFLAYSPSRCYLFAFTYILASPLPRTLAGIVSA